MNVNYSTTTGLYSNVSSTAPRQHGGYKNRLTLEDQPPSFNKSCLEQSVMLSNSGNF